MWNFCESVNKAYSSSEFWQQAVAKLPKAAISNVQSGDSEDAKEFLAQAVQEMMASIEAELRRAVLPEKDSENVKAH